MAVAYIKEFRKPNKTKLPKIIGSLVLFTNMFWWWGITLCPLGSVDTSGLAHDPMPTALNHKPKYSETIVRNP